jgi:hypothetical protein
MSELPEVNIPVDLTLSSTDDLTALEVAATELFAAKNAEEDITSEEFAELERFGEDITRLRDELKVRKQRDADAELREQTRLADEKERLAARVLGPKDPAEDTAPPALTAEDVAVASARGVTAALVAAMGDDKQGDVAERLRTVTASLGEASRYAPAIKTPDRGLLAVTASNGSTVASIDEVASLISQKANEVPIRTTGETMDRSGLAVTIRNDFAHTVDNRTKPQEVGNLFKSLITPDAKDVILAGGGWCAPSENRYDFFNIACEDGLVDLPTVGISRGGINFPTSPSMADVFSATFTNATNPWLWTEDDDILAATGSPTKPCVRVPCPDFTERRLECYGICLTAGNLTDDAYPESTANYLRLLMSAHSHALNARIISTMASLSTASVTGGVFAADGPAYNAVLSGISLAAVDYRQRYGMCSTDVLEVVIPQWIVEVIQADLALRTGSGDLVSVTKAQIQSYFADRAVRVQFVGDWQVRDTGLPGASAIQTAWPDNVTLMIYAAGTFIKGNGLRLDLGVVRDSTLNETNDFTAAWSEECHLVAKVGHESRRYTIALNVAGDTCCYSDS